MYKKYIKRILDIVISFMVLILFSPLYLLIAFLIKIIDKGQIIYTQDRTGKDGNIFKIYKFRTIKNGKTTTLGNFLRMTSLDEIPQFYNVLKGDMSLVGPRPWIPDYYARFNENQKNRNKVRPGLVGLAQVNGRNNLNIMDKLKYDFIYVKNLNFTMDMKIIIKSLEAVWKMDNINVEKKYIQNELDILEKENSNYCSSNK